MDFTPGAGRGSGRVRAGADVRQCAAGRTTSRVGRSDVKRQVIIAGMGFKNSRREKKARIIAVDLRFTPHSH